MAENNNTQNLKDLWCVKISHFQNNLRQSLLFNVSTTLKKITEMFLIFENVMGTTMGKTHTTHCLPCTRFCIIHRLSCYSKTCYSIPMYWRSLLLLFICIISVLILIIDHGLNFQSASLQLSTVINKSGISHNSKFY